MRKSDLLVLPSVEEGFGLVCVEAIGSGAFHWFQRHARTCAGTWKMRSCTPSGT